MPAERCANLHGFARPRNRNPKVCLESFWNRFEVDLRSFRYRCGERVVREKSSVRVVSESFWSRVGIVSVSLRGRNVQKLLWSRVGIGVASFWGSFWSRLLRGPFGTKVVFDWSRVPSRGGRTIPVTTTRDGYKSSRSRFGIDLESLWNRFGDARGDRSESGHQSVWYQLGIVTHTTQYT